MIEYKVEWLEEADIPLSAVNENYELQPRRGKTRVKELAESMERIGLIEPLILRKNGDGTFDIGAGGTRFQAAKLLGWENIPARIINCDNFSLRIIQLATNMKRWVMGNEPEGYFFYKEIQELRENYPESSLFDLIKILAEESGFSKEEILQRYSSFHSKGLRLVEAYEEEPRLPEEKRVYPAHIRYTSKIAQDTLLPFHQVEEIISDLNLPDRAISRIAKSSKNISKRLTDEKKLLEIIKIGNREKGKVQSTFLIPEELSSQLSALAKTLNEDRNSLASRLLQQAVNSLMSLISLESHQ